MNTRYLRLYIHIPFCIKKCAYCDFLSFSSGEEARAQYLAALKRELRARLLSPTIPEISPETLPVGQSPHSLLQISSVFFGGGTPTVLSGEELAGVLETVRECADICGDAEITTEANPCTVDEKKLRILKGAGFSRISIGAQSMNDENLKALGRLHDRARFREAFENARKAGFENINIDLISGLPGQTVHEWENELEEAASFGSEHISVYSLELYEGTPLWERRSEYRWPSDDELAGMYESTAEILEKHGLYRYEISNYAKPGYESRHNTGYWTGDEYLGFGIGAASYERGMRYGNTQDLSVYLRRLSAETIPDPCAQEGTVTKPDLSAIRTDIRMLTKRDRQVEYMILGLRLTRGVSLAEFRERFGEDPEDVYGPVLRKYLESGFLEREGDRLFLAKKALFVSNTVLADFI